MMKLYKYMFAILFQIAYTFSCSASMGGDDVGDEFPKAQYAGPEAFPAHPFEAFPRCSEQPNTQLIQQLVANSINDCEKAIENLALPRYKSLFINNAGLAKTFSEVLKYLQELHAQEIGSEGFAGLCGELKRSLKIISMDFDNPSMGSFESENTRSRASRLQARSIMKMAYEALKEVQSHLDQLEYLSTPIPVFLPPQYSQPTDVLSTALPSKPQIEEGEADIVQTDNTLEITVKTDSTVITFENFWIGSDAKVLFELPSEQAVVLIYQRSSHTSYIFGEIEHPRGLIKLYSLYGSQWSSMNMKRMQSISGKSYQPKKERRYPVDLEGRQIFGERSGEFDRFNPQRKKDDRDTNPDFWQTPEGHFEQEWAAFNEASGDSPEGIIQSRGLLEIAKRYKYEGHAFATALVAQFEHSLARHLYQKAQIVPDDEQFSLIEEAIKICEEASDCKEFAKKKADTLTALACWLQEDGIKTRETDFDNTNNRFRQAIELMRTAEKLDSLMYSNRETVENNFSVVLAERATTLLKDPTADAIVQAEGLLREAIGFNSKFDERRTLRNFIDQIGRAKMPKRGAEMAFVDDEDFSAAAAVQNQRPRVVEQSAEVKSIDEKVAEMISAIKNKSQHPSVLRGFLRKNPEAKDEKYLDSYKDLLNNDDVSSIAKEGLLGAYPHTDLLCLYLQKTKTVSELYLRQLVIDEQFMKEKAVEFFASFVEGLAYSDRALVLETIKASPHAQPELIKALT